MLRALEIDSPRIHIPFDEDGKPILPEPAKTPSESGDEAVRRGAERTRTKRAPASLALAVDRIAIDDARIQAGPWLIEHADVAGRLSLDGTGAFRFALDLPGLGELRNGELALAGLGGQELELSAQSEFTTDLAPLRERFAISPEIEGHARGEFAIEVAGGALRAANANVDVPDLLVRSGDLVVSGPTRGHAVLGESYSLDLTDARVEKTGVFAKPKRTPLSVTGTLGMQPDLSALHGALVKFGANVIPLALDLGRRPMHVHVQEVAARSGALPRAPDRPRARRSRGSSTSTRSTSRSIRFASTETRSWTASRPSSSTGPMLLSGPVHGSGKQVSLENGSALIGGQTIAISGSYDLESGAIAARYDTTDTQLGALLAALSGRSDVDGTLGSNGEFTAAKPEVDALAGSGRLDIRPGRIQGFSLMKSVMGSLAALPALAAESRGKDLSRYDDESFDHLSADYRIADGRLSTENLELAYQNATAFLHGSVGLSDRTLDLAGRIVLSKEADADIAGAKRARERVIPITHITGTVDAPRVELDAKTLASLALAYSGNDKVREKIDKTLGPGGAEAVEGLLNDLLGGKKK